MTIKVPKIERKITQLDIRPVRTPTDLVHYVKTQKEIFDRDFLKHSHDAKERYVNSLIADGRVLHIVWADSHPIGSFALFTDVKLGKDPEHYQYLSSFGFKSDYRYVGFGKAILARLISKHKRLCLHSTSEIKAKFYSKAGFTKISYIPAESSWGYDDYLLSLVPDILTRTGLQAKELSDWLYDYADFSPDSLRENEFHFNKRMENGRI